MEVSLFEASRPQATLGMTTLEEGPEKAEMDRNCPIAIQWLANNINQPFLGIWVLHLSISRYTVTKPYLQKDGLGFPTVFPRCVVATGGV